MKLIDHFHATVFWCGGGGLIYDANKEDIVFQSFESNMKMVGQSLTL